MRIFRIELVRGLGIWVFLPVALVGAYSGYNALPGGSPIWPYAVASLGQVGQVMGPLFGGVGAFAGLRASRRRLVVHERLGSRGILAAGLAEMSALWVWATFSFVVATAAIYIPTALVADGSAPSWPRTLAGLAGLLAEVAVGFSVGRLLPYFLTPVAYAAAVYAGVSFINSSAIYNSWNLFLPENLNLYDEFNHLNGAVAPAQILWYLGLGLVFVTLWALRARPQATTAGALVVSLACAGAGFAYVHRQHAQANDPGVVVSLECAGASPTLCLNPALEHARSRLDAVFAPIEHRLEGTPFQISRIEQRPRGLGSKPSPNAVAFALDDLRNATIAQAGPDLAENAVAPFTACQDDNGNYLHGATSQSLELLGVVADRVATGPHAVTASSDDDVTGLANRFDQMTDVQLKDWLIEHGTEVKACALTRADLQ